MPIPSGELLYGYAGSILSGALVTIQVGFCSLAVALALGLLVAAGKLSRWRPLAMSATAFTTLMRSGPDFVWLLFLYYGGQTALNLLTSRFGLQPVDIDAFVASVIILGVIYSAYLAETFRGAFLAVDKGQAESAQAFGFGRLQTFFHIVFPQMMRFALPGIGNNWLVMLKATAITSMVSLNELIFLSRAAGKATGHGLELLLVAALVYLLLSTVSVLVLRLLATRYAAGSKEISL
ncbi:ABC transporter permease [Pseudomonas sp. QL9]|uniref:ABC transporter permease n=1 Tax=Pseudomonas TaxID=286 RepID=UPI00136244D7|nr:ABC transporter permease subunit [Pseudomonas knackmussii]